MTSATFQPPERFQIEPEERALTGIFGNNFKTYCSQVRRWI
jgi:protein-S-isoprenylcysteine O-methyltransferase Ste14